MALTESNENDKIEVINKWNVQVRNATIIKKMVWNLPVHFIEKH